MEDYHGKREYAHPRDAWLSYYDATLRSKEAPAEADEYKALGVGMLEYYADEWLLNRDPYETFIHPTTGNLCVELNFEIDITKEFSPDDLESWGYDQVKYVGTFDRVIIDENGILWILDYKTAKSISTSFLETDAQCTAYIWAGTHLFHQPVGGIIYQQHLKEVPEEPLLLKGGRLSVNKQQKTTFKLYRDGLIELHGSLQDAPDQNKEFLQELKGLYGKVDGDRFIRRDRVERNPHCHQAEGAKIVAEVSEMLNPNTFLYPNPDRFRCGWCTFKEPCIQFDDGSDAEFILDRMYEPRKESTDRWRKQLNLPQQGNVFLQ
jgi:hypothetical protein